MVPTTEKLNWVEWFTNQPASQIADLRERIMTACKADKRKFYNWKYGHVNVPALAQEKINEIAGQELEYPHVSRIRKEEKESKNS